MRYLRSMVLEGPSQWRPVDGADSRISPSRPVQEQGDVVDGLAGQAPEPPGFPVHRARLGGRTGGAGPFDASADPPYRRLARDVPDRIRGQPVPDATVQGIVGG